ncbi:hypothetical protein [Aeoliella sp.]|uniref:hypothetical protein n=1 Tax=Aeoliella sp. TaxID=2795800 RepID=UPI003CCB7DC7
MSHYQYTLSFQLTDDCPQSVVDFFAQLADGQTPEVVPEVDERQLETSPGEVIALVANRTTLADRRVTIAGAASAEEFFMPFIALAEWLARWSADEGPVGYYHLTSLAHPTLLYFAQGKPYMLQATGTPVGLADGEEMPQEE